MKCPKPSGFFVSAFLFLQIIFAQQVKPVITEIGFTANSFFSQSTLRDRIPIKVNQSLAEEDIQKTKEILFVLYRENGFYSFNVDSVAIAYADDSSAVSLRFFLNEGERIVVSKILFEGNKNISDNELRSIMDVSTGDPLNTPLLESDIRAILNLYSTKGFPFTKIGSENISIDPDDSSTLRIILTIDEGPKIFLAEIQVQGNTSTRTDVVTREARLEQGEMFNQEKLDRIRRRLERSQLFASVAEPQLYLLSGTIADSMSGGLLLAVKEGGTNTFDGIVGYVPETVPGSKGYFTGNIFVSMRNLFGTGRRAAVKWIRENETTQELQVQYLEPWLFGMPFNAGGTFFQRKQDSLYVKTKIDFRAEYAVTEELLFGANLSVENIYPSSALQQFSVFESNTLSFGGEIQYDTRDNVYSPTSGVKYSTTYEEGRKKITGPQKYLYLTSERSFSIQKLTIDVEIFASIFTRQVLAAGIHARQTSSSQLEVSDLYSFGGTNSVRGYRENQFFASRLAWLNFEYRLLTGRSSSFFGFADAGYFLRPDDRLRGIMPQEKNIYGYGIGARVETGLGIMNISYALGEGDTFSSGKIHVGIINEF